MARFSNVYCYPYSGWPDVPWGHARPPETEPTEDDLDIDAAARSARRVTESISLELADSQLSALKSSHQIGLTVGHGPELVSTTLRQRSHNFGNIDIPRGFRFFTPQARAALLATAVERQLDALSALWDWDPAIIRSAARRAREAEWTAAFTGAWKRTPDRTRRVRLFGRILDDGYARWRIGLSELDRDDYTAVSDEVVGWTWISNLRDAARGARFVDDDHLQVPPGSRFLTETYVVQLSTGAISPQQDEHVVLAYPGRADLAPELPDVISHVR